MKNVRKMLSVILAVLFVFAAVPFAVSAADAGECGENVTWTYENGILTISGTGEMSDSDEWGSRWSDYEEPITQIVVNEGITKLPDYAFAELADVVSVSLPTTLESMGDSTFEECEALASIVIPEKITSIAGMVFAGCDSLAEVTMGKSVEEIAEFAFDGCFELNAFNVDDANEHYSSVDGILYNKDQTRLVLCPLNKSGEVVVPDTVREIDEYAFYSCQRVEKVVLPEGISELKEATFCGCKALASIDIPNSVTIIGKYVFAECDKLTEIVIPNGVISIGDRAFQETPLERAIVPSSVIYIGEDAFDCYLYEPSVGLAEVEGIITPSNLTIYCNAGSYAEQYAIDNEINYEIISTELKNVEHGVSVFMLNGTSFFEGMGIAVEKLDNEILKDSVGEEMFAQLQDECLVTIYDIAFQYNGADAQPLEEVEVEINLPLGYKGSETNVFRMEADGSFTQMESFARDSSVVFSTDHFSVYVLVQKRALVPDCTDSEDLDAHSFGVWRTTVQPTAEADGEMVRRCTVCGYEQSEIIPAINEDFDGDFDEDSDEDSDEDFDEDFDEDYDGDSDEDYDEDSDEESDTQACEHKNVSVRGAVAASCSKNGFTGNICCADCGKLVSTGKSIPKTGRHRYSNGVCIDCGAKQTSGNTATNTSSSVNSSNNNKSPNTGDAINIPLWVTIMIISASTLIAFGFYDDKKLFED